ncbi:hypothetical protein AVEN_38863-1 [Araneus ventricosus]|uniref:Uncharacterized protein n=1 Tax=Araneus ventricosus TaxID=182803 RepID=A0A4Y2NTP4_ARAVE|nr:hypothetical protein AVEN_38863-1 [Araneus ventricosus]
MLRASVLGGRHEDKTLVLLRHFLMPNMMRGGKNNTMTRQPFTIANPLAVDWWQRRPEARANWATARGAKVRIQDSLPHTNGMLEIVLVYLYIPKAQDPHRLHWPDFVVVISKA